MHNLIIMLIKQGTDAHCDLSNRLGNIQCSTHDVVHLIAHKTQGWLALSISTEQSAAYSASKFNRTASVSGHSEETLRGVVDPGGTKSEFRNDIWSRSLIVSETSCTMSTWLGTRTASVV